MLRITTAQSFDAGIAQLQQRQRDMATAQEQLTTGKRVTRASDDPIAAARAERAQAQMARSDANERALQASRNSMTQTESALGNAGNLMQQARDALVAAGDATYSDAQRASIADQLSSLRGQLLAVANSSDGSGNYLFAGQGASQAPFVDGIGGVSYGGSAGQSQVSSAEPLALTVDGKAAWLNAPTGNGLFQTGNASAMPGTSGAWINAGSVTDPQAFYAATSPPTVANPSALTYSVTFNPSAGGTTYSILKNGAATAVTNQPYVSGQAMQIDGMSFAVTGQPTASDRFDVKLSTPTTNLFTTLDQAIAELKTPLRSPAAVTQGVQGALAAVDTSMSALQSLRSRVGESLNLTDNVEARVTADHLAAQTEQSNATDLDMVKAISDFQTQQTGYDAALKAYSSVQRMSLFQYINP
jgi:flagellar hook-associated protein 3 FlgL